MATDKPQPRELYVAMTSDRGLAGAVHSNINKNIRARLEAKLAKFEQAIALRCDDLAQDVADGKLSTDAIHEETLPKYLDTRFLPDPDLVIRTSGEARISGFLLWQSAYAEYEFIDTLWPDFTPDIFEHVLRNISSL